MANSTKKQKVKVKTLIPPIVASIFFIVIAISITANGDLLYLSGNSVVNNYMCPTGYKLNGNRCKITTPAIKKGDINTDGKIDDSDINIAQNYINGGISLVNDNLRLADINGDGKVTVSDVNKIKLYAKGLDSDSEYTCVNDYDLDNNKCYKYEKSVLIANREYNKYEAVLYNNDYWYIISTGADYLTLLKKDALNSSELQGYAVDNNLVNYVDSINIKNILEAYIKPISNDLKEVNGNKVRLLNINDLKELGYEDRTLSLYFEESSKTPYWVRLNDSSYFISNNNSNSLGNTFILTDYNNKSYVYETSSKSTLGLIRPVINVYKNKIK